MRESRLFSVAKCLAILFVLIHAAQSVVIENASREVSLTSQRVIQRFRLVMKNDGKSDVSAVTLCLPARLHARAANLDVVQAKGEDEIKKLAFVEPWGTVEGAGKDAVCADYTLIDPLAPGAGVEVALITVFTSVIHPRPAEIHQGDPHLVVFEDSAHVISPYKILTEKAEYALGVEQPESHTAPSPAEMKGEILTLGPYTNVPPFTYTPFEVHYHAKYPFVHGDHVTVTVDVSHWGTVSFDERYHISNSGAKLVGEWSRLMMMSTEAGSEGAINQLPAVVPPSASNIYFRDDIGNISSSRVVSHKGQHGVVLEPRFPLFGGWTTNFMFGYTVPLAGNVFKDKEHQRYTLTIPLAPSITQLATEDLEVRILLPEGASDPQVMASKLFEQSVEKEYTYLDVLGRPVVVLRFKNVVMEGKGMIQVNYRFAGWMMFQKPFILGTVLVAAILVLLVLSVASSTPPEVASKLKTQ